MYKNKDPTISNKKVLTLLHISPTWKKNVTIDHNYRSSGFFLLIVPTRRGKLTGKTLDEACHQQIMTLNKGGPSTDGTVKGVINWG